MPDIIITPSIGKLEFIDNSAQVTRRHSFTLDHSDGLVLDAPLSAAAISAPLNVINVTVNNSNANYPFVLAQSGETGAKFAEGSWWQAFNAVTYMTDHLMGRSNDARLQSAWFGVNKSLKNKALQLAIDMANAA